MDTREIVELYFNFVNKHDWEGYLSLFAEDVVMDEQLMGHMEGIDAVRKGIEVLRNNPGFRNEPREIVVEGNRAMALWHITAPLPDGSKIEADGANFYRIKSGKIAYFTNRHDPNPFHAVTGR
jgi:ketosteroid isomerase-like protein